MLILWTWSECLRDLGHGILESSSNIVKANFDVLNCDLIPLPKVIKQMKLIIYPLRSLIPFFFCFSAKTRVLEPGKVFNDIEIGLLGFIR